MSTRRLVLVLAAAAALAAPLGAAAESHHGWGGHEGGGRWSAGEHGRGDHGGGDRGWNRGGGDHRWDGGDFRWEHREERWDDRRYNGYWFNNRWFYGPPPQTYQNTPGYRPGYSHWRQGGFLPPYYNSWILNDYASHQLRRPPYGYHWVQIGNDFLLVSSRTSVIFDVIVGGY